MELSLETATGATSVFTSWRRALIPTTLEVHSTILTMSPTVWMPGYLTTLSPIIRSVLAASPPLLASVISPDSNASSTTLIRLLMRSSRKLPILLLLVNICPDAISETQTGRPASLPTGGTQLSSPQSPLSLDSGCRPLPNGASGPP